MSGYRNIDADTFTPLRAHVHFDRDEQFYMHVDTYIPSWKVHVSTARAHGVERGRGHPCFVRVASPGSCLILQVFVFAPTKIRQGPFHFVFGSHRNTEVRRDRAEIARRSRTPRSSIDPIAIVNQGKLRWLHHRSRHLLNETSIKRIGNLKMRAVGPFSEVRPRRSLLASRQCSRMTSAMYLHVDRTRCRPGDARLRRLTAIPRIRPATWHPLGSDVSHRIRLQAADADHGGRRADAGGG